MKMNTKSAVAGGLLALMASLLGCVASHIDSSPGMPPGWLQTLQHRGFTVQNAQWGIFDLDSCMHSDICYAMNPITPYGLLYLPPHPEETASAVPYNNTCHLHNICKTVNGTNYSMAWRLAKGEVIAVVGMTPPECVYWSFTNYIYTRWHPDGWKAHPTPVHQVMPCKDGPSRCEVFASVNDPLNMQTANGAFESPLNLLLTTDSKSEGIITEAIRATTDAPITPLRFPGAELKLGVTTGEEDELSTWLRVNAIADPVKREKFYNPSTPPFKVYRITPPKGFVVEPDEEWASFEGRMRQRVTGTKESISGVSGECDTPCRAMIGGWQARSPIKSCNLVSRCSRAR